MATPRDIGGPTGDEHKRTLDPGELAELRQNEQLLGRSPPVPNVPIYSPSDHRGQQLGDSGTVRAHPAQS